MDRNLHRFPGSAPSMPSNSPRNCRCAKNKACRVPTSLTQRLNAPATQNYPIVLQEAQSNMTISRAQAEERMWAKLANPAFMADVRPLLAAD
jgi:hypothetical protein